MSHFNRFDRRGSKSLFQQHHFNLILGECIKLVWILQDQHYMSTLLHLSMKNSDNAPYEKIKALNIIKQKLLSSASTKYFVVPATSNAVITRNWSEINSTATVELKNLLVRGFDKLRQVVKSIPTPLKELDDYMASDIAISGNDNILTFWRNNEQRYPTLCTIVRKLFAILASNTIVERLFSASKNIMTDKRTSLNEDKLDKLLFLKKKLVLKEMKKKELIKHQVHPKRTFSVTDHESALIINESENLAPSSTSKKVRRRNEDDNDSNDNDPKENLADNDSEDMENSIEADKIFCQFIN